MSLPDEPLDWGREQARRFMVAWHGLQANTLPTGDAGLRAALAKARCIQLDPLEPIGTNADLVALARVDGVRLGQVYEALLPGHAFEHFAKERCLLPPDCFPHYRERLVQTPWWRLSSRLERLPTALIEDVLAELRERGPLTPDALEHRGEVKPLDWSGWKGTGKANTMALEVLATRCQVVVCGRTGRGKLYDVPERALPEVARARPQGSFARWALVERARSAGLLALAQSPSWSMLSGFQRDHIVAEAVEDGALRLVRVEGSRRLYLAPAEDPEVTEPDDRMRILGPLDPLIWDRKLVQQIFGFEYIWEVYKPAEKRRWGWYVCPLLHRGRLVGRIEAHREGGRVVVDRLWREAGEAFDDAALAEAIARHEAAMA